MLRNRQHPIQRSGAIFAKISDLGREVLHIRRYFGWLLIAYSTYAILYGQFGRTRLRFTHTPFYYASFILLVLGVILVSKRVAK